MRFLIYGAGALGQAIGCMLAADGHQVDLVLRPRFIEVLQTLGLEVTGIFGEFRVFAEKLGLLREIRGRDGRDYDAILLTTKTYDTDTAIGDIAALSECYCPVVSLQNGCGNLEKLAEAESLVDLVLEGADHGLGGCRPSRGMRARHHPGCGPPPGRSLHPCGDAIRGRPGCVPVALCQAPL